MADKDKDGKDFGGLLLLAFCALIVSWWFGMFGSVFTSPALSSDGATVFVGSLDGKFYAICATSGTQKWVFRTGGAVISPPALSSDGATVFVGS
jgi:outer membrane protein assembly factor BamB